MNKVDKKVFIPAYLVLLLVSLPIIINPEGSEKAISIIQTFLITKLGFLYSWYGIFAFIFVGFIAFSKYGKIKLGDQDDKPEFKTFSWAAMLFCAGIGAGVIYWGAIEWVYYYQTPPLGAEVGSWQAAETAAAYGIFHWGPAAWAIYSVAACAVGYLYYVRKTPVLKISEACRAVLGNSVDGILGKIIDIAFMFGLLGATATSLGIGAPLATSGLARVLGIEVTLPFELLIIAIITGIFATSAFLGLKKGIKVLSDINVWLTFVLVIFVFVAGNTVFMLNMGSTAVGRVMQQFPQMMTWLDPAGESMFPQWWTVFYWAWWGAYAPFMGMFIAKISKGRTIKNMLLGAIGFGTAGCVMFFSVLGNYGLDLQLKGEMDVVASLAELGGPETVIQIFENLPGSTFVILIIAVISIVFMATTFDSASYVLAAVSQYELKQNEDPQRWLRLLWAFSLALVPIGFMLMGSPLSVLQTASIVAALPVSVIVIITAISFIKMAKEDKRV
ncbi:BCCT family transporter [Vallitalea okinawensis]|uniref:BCCT family transporter n=1 Tax=Vallitalea okinawensis TaxID=2078660 RepID=UPI000CFADD46|nr:BCCT family transporter [Vallitalea okinawensis]